MAFAVLGAAVRSTATTSAPRRRRVDLQPTHAVPVPSILALTAVWPISDLVMTESFRWRLTRSSRKTRRQETIGSVDSFLGRNLEDIPVGVTVLQSLLTAPKGAARLRRTAWTVSA